MELISWQMLLYSSILVVGICEWVKKYDKKDKMKQFYKYLPILLATAAATVLGFALDVSFWTGVFNGLLIFSTSTLAYDTVVETINRKMKG